MNALPQAARCLALALLGMCSLAAARDLDQDEALALRQQGIILPFERLLETALGRYPGARLLEAELEEKHGRYEYEVELLTPRAWCARSSSTPAPASCSKTRKMTECACCWSKTTCPWPMN